MTFQLSILLWIYIGFLLVWFGFFMVALYHMFKFGYKNFITFFTTLIFAGVAVLMIMAAGVFIGQIDWSAEITIFNGFANTGLGF